MLKKIEKTAELFYLLGAKLKLHGVGTLNQNFRFLLAASALHFRILSSHPALALFRLLT
jgi:hypothetical protein